MSKNLVLGISYVVFIITIKTNVFLLHEYDVGGGVIVVSVFLYSVSTLLYVIGFGRFILISLVYVLRILSHSFSVLGLILCHLLYLIFRCLLLQDYRLLVYIIFSQTKGCLFPLRLILLLLL